MPRPRLRSGFASMSMAVVAIRRAARVTTLHAPTSMRLLATPLRSMGGITLVRRRCARAVRRRKGASPRATTRGRSWLRSLSVRSLSSTSSDIALRRRRSRSYAIPRWVPTRRCTSRRVQHTRSSMRTQVRRCSKERLWRGTAVRPTPRRVIEPGGWTFERQHRGRLLRPRRIAGNVRSDVFHVSSDVYVPVKKQAMRMYYYQRDGIAKLAQYAGQGWADGVAHPQDSACHLCTNWLHLAPTWPSDVHWRLSSMRATRESVHELGRHGRHSALACVRRDPRRVHRRLQHS